MTNKHPYPRGRQAPAVGPQMQEIQPPPAQLVPAAPLEVVIRTRIAQLEEEREEFLETAQKRLDGYAVAIGELRRLIGEEVNEG